MIMKYLKLFEDFGKKYFNVKLEDDGEYYQVPFSIFNEEIGFGEDYKLFFNSWLYYDDIATDEDIYKYLNSDLNDISVNKDWSNYTKDIFAKTNKEFHVKRIAKIVHELKKHVPINPVMMFFDERAYEFCPNYIEDGNHRLRALYYLKYDYFPVYIYGSHAKYLIEYLSNLK